MSTEQELELGWLTMMYILYMTFHDIINKISDLGLNYTDLSEDNLDEIIDSIDSDYDFEDFSDKLHDVIVRFFAECNFDKQLFVAKIEEFFTKKTQEAHAAFFNSNPEVFNNPMLSPKEKQALLSFASKPLKNIDKFFKYALSTIAQEEIDEIIEEMLLQQTEEQNPEEVKLFSKPRMQP